MTDGNTGNLVAPASMEDTMKLSAMFQRAAKAIVEASEYPQQVADLQAAIDKLQFELNAKSTHAEQLDRSLAELRQERDALKADNVEKGNRIFHMNNELDQKDRTIIEQDTKLHETEQSLDEAKAERDKYGLQMLNLEEQVKEWRGKAEAARAKLHDLATMFQPEPEPTSPTPVDVPSFLAGPNNEVVKTSDVPSAPEPAMQSPEPSPKPTPDTRPEYIDEWEPGYFWDGTGRYKRSPNV